MSELKQMAALTSLNDMMQKGYPCICTIDKIAEMLGVNPKGEAYTILRTLHCVHFEKMPPELKSQIPELIKQCLSIEPTYQFAQIHHATVVADPLADVERQEGRRGFMRLLTGKP